MRVAATDVRAGATYRDRAHKRFVVLIHDNGDGSWAAITLPGRASVTVNVSDLDYVAIIQQAEDGGI